MENDSKLDRKQFLTLTLAAAGGALLGCAGSDSGRGTGAAGQGGAGTSGTSGASGTSGTSGAAGAGGSAAGGSSGTAGASGTSGTAGASGTSGTAGATGGGGTGGAAANCGTSLKVTITNNHGPGHDHVLTIALTEITAHQTKVYSTKGQAHHDHFVQLTAADFMALAAGKELRKPACNEDHEHEYIVNCLGTDGVSDPNVSAFCGDATAPMNRTCGESMTHTCPDGPYPKN